MLPALNQLPKFHERSAVFTVELFGDHVRLRRLSHDLRDADATFELRCHDSPVTAFTTPFLSWKLLIQNVKD